MGMPHRGRLNVLANVLHKPLEQILCEFRGSGVGTPADLARLRERSDRVFARFDADGSGELEMSELQAALEIIGIQASLDEVVTTEARSRRRPGGGAKGGRRERRRGAGAKIRTCSVAPFFRYA